MLTAQQTRLLERDINFVRQGEQSGLIVHLGDMYNSVTQQDGKLEKAAAAYVTTSEPSRAEGLALTLHRLYPHLNIYVRVNTLREQDKLVSRGIKKAGTGDIVSTLVREAMLLKDLDMSESDVNELVKAFQNDNYALVKAEYDLIKDAP